MPGPPKHIPKLAGKVRFRNTLKSKSMAATDLVPCFYTGQDYRWERPAKLEVRSRVRELKDANLGKFVENGKFFLLFKTIVQATTRAYNGPLGRGNLLPFARRTTGEPLHYSIPMAGDIGLRRHNLFRRADGKNVARLHGTVILVSTRNLFSRRSHRELFPTFGGTPEPLAATVNADWSSLKLPSNGVPTESTQ